MPSALGTHTLSGHFLASGLLVYGWTLTSLPVNSSGRARSGSSSSQHPFHSRCVKITAWKPGESGTTLPSLPQFKCLWGYSVYATTVANPEAVCWVSISTWNVWSGGSQPQNMKIHWLNGQTFIKYLLGSRYLVLTCLLVLPKTPILKKYVTWKRRAGQTLLDDKQLEWERGGEVR